MIEFFCRQFAGHLIDFSNLRNRSHTVCSSPRRRSHGLPVSYMTANREWLRERPHILCPTSNKARSAPVYSGINDYSVLERRQRIGRIRFAIDKSLSNSASFHVKLSIRFADSPERRGTIGLLSRSLAIIGTVC
jgi:hypothetical protein